MTQEITIAPAGDIKRFAKLLVDTLSDSERCQRLTAQAQNRAQDYDVSDWAPSWVDVIEETASSI